MNGHAPHNDLPLAGNDRAIAMRMVDLLRAQHRQTGEVSDAVLRRVMFTPDVIKRLYPAARDFLNRELARSTEFDRRECFNPQDGRILE